MKLLLLAVFAAGVLMLGHSIGHVKPNDQDSWAHLVVQDAGHYCAPIASTPAQQEKGLQGVSKPGAPMVFTWPQVGARAFWMKDTPVAIRGAWVRNHRIVGLWYGKPDTTKLHLGRADEVLEFPVTFRSGRRLRKGARVTLGESCSAPYGQQL
jgi:uncharacterized membrane protein (UPF0127 family)